MRAVHADGTLPAPGVYGVPEQWPHIRALLAELGFRAERAESVLVARIPDLAATGPVPPVDGMTVQRSVGGLGTRLTARCEGQTLGFVEVDALLDGAPAVSRTARWADVAEWWVQPEWRGRGVGRWLLAEAARWLHLGGTEMLLAYADARMSEDGVGVPDPDAVEYAALIRCGFHRITTTVRGLTLHRG